MIIEPGLIPLAFAVLALMALSAVPLAAATFFAAALLVCLNPNPLPDGFFLNYSLAMRLNSPALISIPLAALAGELALASGHAAGLLETADAIAGTGRRSVGARAILGCAFLGAVSGMGPAAAREQTRRLLRSPPPDGFRREDAAGAIAAAAGLCVIIPASPALTIYAAAAGLPANIVFTASFLPGVLAAAALLAASRFFPRLADNPAVAAEIPPIRRRAALWRAKWSILLPVLTLATLFSGFFNAPEAAAFASAYAAIACLRRPAGLAAIMDAMRQAALAAAEILLLVGVAGLFLSLLEAAGFQQRLAERLFALAGGSGGAIILMNLLLLAAGCLLDLPAIVALAAPLLLPLAAKCGLSPPHFGAMLAVNVAVGLLTPPQAANLAAAAREAGTGSRQSARASLPFLAALLLCLAATAAVPELSLWLPAWFGWPV
ncbi:MAG: TRAP transporter large permease subunit [Planctomycetota bacterium]|jgi:C4-dicarboxylate transporter DctM subunit|nr:TRAP transporter large permease subunit [Planctomycetota bacterium]